jgi:hypothetical protein
MSGACPIRKFAVVFNGIHEFIGDGDADVHVGKRFEKFPADLVDYGDARRLCPK